eukprot:scaffold2154_cov169-Alexandrium_tamarense.AAC.4
MTAALFSRGDRSTDDRNMNDKTASSSSSPSAIANKRLSTNQSAIQMAVTSSASILSILLLMVSSVGSSASSAGAFDSINGMGMAVDTNVVSRCDATGGNLVGASGGIRRRNWSSSSSSSRSGGTTILAFFSPSKQSECTFYSNSNRIGSSISLPSPPHITTPSSLPNRILYSVPRTPTTTTTTLLQALGRNYLDQIDGDDSNGNGSTSGSTNGSNAFRDGSVQNPGRNRWNFGFGRNSNGSGGGSAAQNSIAGRQGGGRGGGGGAAIRPPTSMNSATNSYGRGGGGPKPWGPQSQQQQQGGHGGGGNNGAGQKIVPIKQPQDLLDFVIEDERLSVGEFELVLFKDI